MSAPIYTIDKMLSIQEHALALRIEGHIPQELTSLFKKAKTSDNAVLIPYSQTNQVLKILATKGELYFNSKQIVIDLFGKTEFYYQVQALEDKSPLMQGMLKTSSQEYPLQTCDFLCGGPPHWFIKGFSLKFISTNVSYKDLREAFEGKIRSIREIEEEANLDSDAPRVVFIGDCRSIYPVEEDPLPVLILKDRSGAFADLWLDYHIGDKIPFNHTNQVLANKRKRNFASEKAWEKDLLETGYIKKIVNSSHYYCPLDKVAKSLGFLLELGWTVIDHQGNRVVPHTKTELTAESTSQAIAIKGKVKFGDFQVDITNISGAFNRRERFIQLNTGIVGLLPNHLEQNGLDLLLEESEIVGDALHMNKNRLGSLSDLLDSSSIALAPSLELLKNKLLAFKGIELAPPRKSFNGQLRPYQQEGLNWLTFLYEHGFHGILADDMGLGKTVQVLAFLSRLEPPPSPILIIVPTSLIFNWHREIERFLPTWSIVVHHGTKRAKELTTFTSPTIILTSYTTLRLDLPLFCAREFTCIVLDEAQVIKNHYTQTFQAVKKLKGQFRLEITGTPVENHLRELWTHFHFLIPTLFGDEASFAAEIQAGASDPRFLKRIKKKIRPFLLRRKKEEVAQDLPEKIEQVIWLEMEEEQRNVYEKFLAGVRSNLIKKVECEGIGKHRIEILEAILRLRQICCHPLLVTAHQTESCTKSSKLEALIQDLETIREEGSKALIYSQFTSMLSLVGKTLTERGWPYAYLDGSTQNREKVIGDFQENPLIPFFLISLKAGGVGINLTAADYVLLYDPWWNEAIESQAIARAHRIGRKKTVIARRYVIAESIEEKIMKLKGAKKALTTDLLDDDIYHLNLNEDDLLFLFS